MKSFHQSLNQMEAFMGQAFLSTADFPAVKEAGRAASAQLQFYKEMMTNAPSDTSNPDPVANWPCVREAARAASAQMDFYKKMMEK